MPESSLLGGQSPGGRGIVVHTGMAVVAAAAAALSWMQSLLVGDNTLVLMGDDGLGGILLWTGRGIGGGLVAHLGGGW